MLKLTLKRATKKRLQKTFIQLQFMVRSWTALNGTQNPALCIPHSSQAPVSPLEVWLEHELQATVDKKISDNSALRVQRRSLFLRIASLVFPQPAELNAHFICSSSPPSGNSEPVRESQCSLCNPKISVLQETSGITWVTLGQGEGCLQLFPRRDHINLWLPLNEAFIFLTVKCLKQPPIRIFSRINFKD